MFFVLFLCVASVIMLFLFYLLPPRMREQMEFQVSFVAAFICSYDFRYKGNDFNIIWVLLWDLLVIPFKFRAHGPSPGVGGRRENGSRASTSAEGRHGDQSGYPCLIWGRMMTVVICCTGGNARKFFFWYVRALWDFLVVQCEVFRLRGRVLFLVSIFEVRQDKVDWGRSERCSGWAG